MKSADETLALAPHVFQRAGEPIGDFRNSWATACDGAKLPGLLFNDFRRSAVREMRLGAGAKQMVAMKVTGHKTDSLWRRYRITSAEEVREGRALTLRATRAQQDLARNVVTPRSAGVGGKA